MGSPDRNPKGHTRAKASVALLSEHDFGGHDPRGVASHGEMISAKRDFAVKRSHALDGCAISEVLWPPAKARPGRGEGRVSFARASYDSAFRMVRSARSPSTDSASHPVPSRRPLRDN